jgi:hypothetical protein
MTARSALAASVALMAAVGPAWAADRSQYSLVNPTPGHLLREMTTDRPDITEVPFTIDPGRVQIEASVFNYARFRDPGGAVSHSYDFMVTNVRIGLTPNFEAASCCSLTAWSASNRAAYRRYAIPASAAFNCAASITSGATTHSTSRVPPPWQSCRL